MSAEKLTIRKTIIKLCEVGITGNYKKFHEELKMYQGNIEDKAIMLISYVDTNVSNGYKLFDSIHSALISLGNTFNNQGIIFPPTLNFYIQSMMMLNLLSQKGNVPLHKVRAKILEMENDNSGLLKEYFAKLRESIKQDTKLYKAPMMVISKL